MPRNRFDQFWTLLRPLLTAQGRVPFIDKHIDDRDKETYIAHRSEIVQRTLPAAPRGPNPLAGVLEDRLSRERLKPYRDAVGGDLDSAIGLYEWNSAAPGAFFETTLGHVEVLLRNALHDHLSAWHTAAGRPGQRYDDPAGVLDPRRHADIAAARGRIRREHKTETAGKVVAELTFGF